MSKRFLSVGDIVGFYSPTHANRGYPGDTWRHAVILGMEIDPYNNKMEALWLCRLSDRMDKIRGWDFLLNADEIVTTSDIFKTGEWVARTHQIHLIPTKKEFFGDTIRIYGRIVPELLGRFAEKLDEGQSGSLNSAGYGPRLKLPHTVVKAFAEAPDSYNYFDYHALLMDGLKGIHPLALKDHESSLAERDDFLQRTEHAIQIQQQFQSNVQNRKQASKLAKTPETTETPILPPAVR